MRLPVLFVVFLLLGHSAAVRADEAEAAAYLTKHEVPLPTSSEVVVCHGFGCKYRTSVRLANGDISRLREILKRGQRSASAEIEAIANAVAWFERRIGPHTGTSRRTPRAGPDQAGERYEADCIDESVNTTALLLLASQLNLLRHHEVEAPQSRGYLIDGRYPHATAVVADLRSGARWAVDPWTKRNGERPDTLPIERWMQGS
jgi:hypothetical protein